MDVRTWASKRSKSRSRISSRIRTETSASKNGRYLGIGAVDEPLCFVSFGIITRMENEKGLEMFRVIYRVHYAVVVDQISASGSRHTARR